MKKKNQKKFKDLEVRFKYLNKKVSSTEHERDVLRRWINEKKKEKKIEECELKPDIRKQRDTVTGKDRILPQSTSRGWSVQNATSTVWYWKWSNKDNSLIDDNLNIKEQVKVLGKKLLLS